MDVKRKAEILREMVGCKKVRVNLISAREFGFARLILTLTSLIHDGAILQG